MSQPVETKVKAATAGSTVGVALAALLIYLLDTLVYRDSDVPDAVVGAIVTLLPIGLTYLGGWLAPHSSRA